MKETSLVSMICNLASRMGYHESAKKELEETGRIRFRLNSFVFMGEITSWRIVHIRSNSLFIVLA